MPVASQATPAEIVDAGGLVYVCRLLAIEGIPLLFTDDSTSEILGSGADSWIGAWEDDAGLAVGERTVLPGLTIPDSISEAMDVKTGLLQSRSATFRLVDYDGQLARLFAKEGKAYAILAEDIPPGSGALGTSVATTGGGTVNPRGRHLGLERIGPAGERGYFSPFPFTISGRHHQVNAFGAAEEGPRPVLISADPIDFKGRRVALYQLVRRGVPRPGTRDAWPLWHDQYADLGVLWWGELTDRGVVYGSREWEIRCDGALSWLQKTLNQSAPGWQSVADLPISLSDAERYAAVEYRWAAGGMSTSIGHSQSLLAAVMSAVGGADTWRSDINAFLADVASGGTFDYGSTDFDTFNNASVTMLDDNSIRVRRDSEDVFGASSGYVEAEIVLHEIVWRAWGFDPILQDPKSSPYDSETQSHWRKLDPGEAYSNNVVTPGPGYWVGRFNSIALGVDRELGSFFPGDDNGGNPRLWKPITEGDVTILRGPQTAPQQIALGFDQPYLEPVPTVQWTDAEIEGTPVDGARYFAIKGKRIVGTPVSAGQIMTPEGEIVDYGAADLADFATVVRCSWAASTYGTLVESDGRPAMQLERYEEPRNFGVPYDLIDGDWAMAPDEDGAALQIAPLFTIGYGASASLGRAVECFYQLLLSTGSAGGWDGDESTDPTFADGENTPVASAEPWCVDALKADQGLAIPRELVAAPDDQIAEWERVPGGSGGPLSRVGLAYVGPTASLDIIQSLIRSRALALSLHGGEYGVTFLAPFSPDEAAVTIGADDLFADPEKPDEAIPRQDIRAVGQLDRVELKWRHNPLEGSTSNEDVFRSRDREAQSRRGDLRLEITDDGLTEGGPWQTDFRELWEVDRAEFFARRHFLIRDLPIKPAKGLQIRVGTRVLLSNPWPVNPTATGAQAHYGITNACGIVTEWTYLRAGYYRVSVLVFAGQADGVRLFMPIGRIVSVSGADIELEPADESRGISGASAFDRPAWASALLHARVRILSHDRDSWSLSSVYTVGSVSGDTVTTTASVAASAAYRDQDRYLVIAEYAQQSGRWPESYGAPIVLDTLQHPGGQGSPLEP